VAALPSPSPPPEFPFTERVAIDKLSPRVANGELRKLLPPSPPSVGMADGRWRDGQSERLCGVFYAIFIGKGAPCESSDECWRDAQPNQH
jgi:hypothetical protein